MQNSDYEPIVMGLHATSAPILQRMKFHLILHRKENLNQHPPLHQDLPKFEVLQHMPDALVQPLPEFVAKLAPYSWASLLPEPHEL
jgi:hypothetical protein